MLNNNIPISPTISNDPQDVQNNPGLDTCCELFPSMAFCRHTFNFDYPEKKLTLEFLLEMKS